LDLCALDNFTPSASQAKLPRTGPQARARQVALRDLLEVHPAFAQTLAKSPELRSVVESGTEAIMQPLNASGSVSATRVLWTVCNCTWQAISVVISGLCGQTPSAGAPLELQMRHLSEVNDNLREQLAKCRRDYLREVTEVRERSRKMEQHLEVALTEVLYQEPVMFFEPLDFVFDDVTKDFVRDTVEEKLRLLMMKGWRKVSDKELEELRSRVAELETERGQWQELARGVAELDASNPTLLPGSNPATKKVGDALHAHFLDMLRAAGKRVQELEAEAPVLRDNLKALQHRIEELQAEEIILLSDGDCVDAVEKQCEKRPVGDDTMARLKPGSERRVDSRLTFSAAPASARGPDTNSAGCAQANTDLQRELSALDHKHMDLKRKLGRMTKRLRESSDLKGYDQEVVSEALAFAGLEEPGNVTDRLYADANRRLLRMQGRSSEVHVMQRAELERCSNGAREGLAKKRVEEIRGMHRDAVKYHNAFQEALESFHVDASLSGIEEEQLQDVTATSPHCSENSASAVPLLGRCSSSGSSSGRRRSMGTLPSRFDDKENSEQDRRDIHMPLPSACGKAADMFTDTASVWRSLSRPVATPQRSRHNPAWQSAAHLSLKESCAFIEAAGRSTLRPHGALDFASSSAERLTIQHTLAAAPSVGNHQSPAPKPSALAQTQHSALREVFLNSNRPSHGPKGWLPHQSGQCANGTALLKPSPRESALAECAAAMAEAPQAKPQAKPQSQSVSPLLGFREFRPATAARNLRSATRNRKPSP